MSDWSGLIWQHPAYGFTALAVLIPIIIHLLNRSRGKLVTFAHVALLRNTAPKPSYELRLSQRLLLLLRMLLLVLAALLLSQPWWPSPSDKHESILVSVDWLNSSNASDKQQLATRLGEQTAILLDGPAVATKQQTLSPEAIINWSSQAVDGTQNIWAKIHSHASSLAPQTTMVIYTTNRASQYSGNKMTIHQPLEWQIKKLDSTALPAQALNILLVYQAQRQQDVAAIRAALEALASQSLGTIEVNTVTQADFEQSQADSTLLTAQLVWWLSSAPLAPQLLHGPPPLGVIIDGPDAASEQHWQADSTELLVSALTGHRLAGRSNPGFDSQHSELLWQTTQGLPLLSRYSTPTRNVLQFYSRFNPRWSNASSLASFPLLLADLLHTALPAMLSANAVLDPAQIEQQPALSPPVSEPAAANIKPVDAPDTLTALLGLLLVLVFALERLYSEKTKGSTAHRARQEQV